MMARTVGSYTIVRTIGIGATSDVYLATHNVLHMTVALKRISKKYEENALKEIEILNHVSTNNTYNGTLNYLPITNSNQNSTNGNGSDLIVMPSRNLICLYEYFVDEEYYYLVLEYGSRGTLGSLCDSKPIAEIDARGYFADIIVAVEELHSNYSVLHRDIKSENVLIKEDGSLMMVDFGLAMFNNASYKAKINSSIVNTKEGVTNRNNTYLRRNSNECCNNANSNGSPIKGGQKIKNIFETDDVNMITTNFEKEELNFEQKLINDRKEFERNSGEMDVTNTHAVGSPAYVAPEVFIKNSYSTKSDIYACGVLLYKMLTSVFPFFEEDILKLFHKVASTEPSFPSNLSPEAVDLMQRMLAKNPAERITIDEIKHHAWFRNGTQRNFFHGIHYITPNYSHGSNAPIILFRDLPSTNSSPAASKPAPLNRSALNTSKSFESTSNATKSLDSTSNTSKIFESDTQSDTDKLLVPSARKRSLNSSTSASDIYINKFPLPSPANITFSLTQKDSIETTKPPISKTLSTSSAFMALSSSTTAPIVPPSNNDNTISIEEKMVNFLLEATEGKLTRGDIEEAFRFEVGRAKSYRYLENSIVGMLRILKRNRPKMEGPTVCSMQQRYATGGIQQRRRVSGNFALSVIKKPNAYKMPSLKASPNLKARGSLSCLSQIGTIL